MTVSTKAAWPVAALALVLTLAGCSSSDPLDQDTDGDSDSDTAEGGGDTVVVGSQAYYSNEVIAEIYAQALDEAGFSVEREFNIGQRDAYMPSLEDGDITIFPEYTGNLLQFYDSDTSAREPDEVYEELAAALPEGLDVLEPAEATDQDSYTVTTDFADEHDISTIEDLAEVDDDLTLGGPPELAERPYGPEGLDSVYGIDVDFEATGDTTVDDLIAGTVNVANVYTSDPRIQTENLVVLTDPESLFLASEVVPVVDAEMADELAEVIDPISAALSPDALIDMNVQSQVEEKSPQDIAADWLEGNGL